MGPKNRHIECKYILFNKITKVAVQWTGQVSDPINPQEILSVTVWKTKKLMATIYVCMSNGPHVLIKIIWKNKNVIRISSFCITKYHATNQLTPCDRKSLIMKPMGRRELFPVVSYQSIKHLNFFLLCRHDILHSMICFFFHKNNASLSWKMINSTTISNKEWVFDDSASLPS